MIRLTTGCSRRHCQSNGGKLKVKMEGDPRLVVHLLEQVIAFDMENHKS